MDDSFKVENDKEAVTEIVVSKPVQERRKLLRRLVTLAGLGITGVLLSQDKTSLLPPVAATGNIVANATNTGNTGTTELDTSVNGAGFIVFNSDDSGGSSGVVGEGTGTTEINYGVIGESRSTANAGSFTDPSLGAAGVYGVALSTSSGRFSTGVLGVNEGLGSDGYGVVGVNKGTGSGVLGLSSQTDFGNSHGVGVEGVVGAPHGIGVKGSCGLPFQVGFPDGVPLVAQGVSGQTGNLQEWRNGSGTALSVINKDGWCGVGTSSPTRSVHLLGDNACFRMDRDVNSAAFILVRTAAGSFNTVWKTFYVGVDASGSNNGSFFIGDAGTAVSGNSQKRLIIDNSGNIVPPTDVTGNIGTDSLRWALVRAKTVTSGDLVFENGARVKEEGDGFQFVNPQGTKIAVLDREGNFRVKGRITEDPTL